MSNEKISVGSARALQLMVILFLTPLWLFLVFIIFTKNLSVEGLLFLIFSSSIIALILYVSFSYADLYVSGEFLITKRLFTSSQKLLSEISDVDRALTPFSFYIKFTNNTKVYFTSKHNDIPKILLNIDPDSGSEKQE
jgi:hypothetical protein